MKPKRQGERTAKEFYKEIEQDQDKYKLVNGLFIVKYLDDNETSFYVGDLLKANSPQNNLKKNIVLIRPNQELLYNKIKKLSTTTLGFWRPLGIKFIETPIKDILKDYSELKSLSNRTPI